MNAKRWMALFLALTLAITMLAGCTKKTETPVADPEQGQTEQETQNQTQPVTPQQPEQEEKPQPEEPMPDEPQDEQQPVQEPELTPGMIRRRRSAPILRRTISG